MARGERVFRLPPPFSRGPEVGFKILGFSGFDLEDPEVSEIWEGPRFDAPTLGLRDSTAGEIVLAARPFLGGRSTVNRVYFNRAVQAEGEEAEELWRYCLQSGDLMAHYGLTYTLYDLGRHREAYRHLRAYTELVPADGWAWSCLGKACEAMEATDEAESTYRKAINLDGDGITGKTRDLHELAGLDPRYGPAIIQRDALFKVLDVYQLRGRSQVALLHVPAELVDRLRTQEPNAIEEEIVGAARRDFEQILQSPTVPAVTEPEWTDRVAFPLGMNDEGELFYEGSSLEGHGS